MALLCVDHSYQSHSRWLITEVCSCVSVGLSVWLCAYLCDLNDCTTKSLNGFSQSSNADAAAFQELYDVKHQRKGNNDHIHEMSFSSTFISGICWVLFLYNIMCLPYPKWVLCLGSLSGGRLTSFSSMRCRKVLYTASSILTYTFTKAYTRL